MQSIQEDVILMYGIYKKNNIMLEGAILGYESCDA